MQQVLNKESIKYGESVTLETIICYKCAMPFAVPVRYKEMLRDSQETFYCPNGHPQAYTTSTESILRRQLEKQKEDSEKSIRAMQNKIESAEFFMDRAIKEKTAIKGQMTKLKKRIENGVCPCCNRTFENLQRHMQTKHPDVKL